MRRRFVRLVVVCAIVVGAGAVGMAAVSGGRAVTDTPRGVVTRPGFLAPALSASSLPAVPVASRLSVFMRAPTSADALPAGDRAQLRQGYASEHPDVADARRVKASGGQAAYLIPARAGVCVVNANEAFCDPLTSWPGADAVDLCSPTLPVGRLEIEWLLPDGARRVALRAADGSTTRFASRSNVYIARLPINRSLPKTIAWDDAQGHRHSRYAGIPSDAPSLRCAHPGAATSMRRAIRPRLPATPHTATASLV